jgi:hypothetical protein
LTLVLQNVWAKHEPVFWPVAPGVLEYIPPGGTLAISDLDLMRSQTQRVALAVFVDAGMIVVAPPDPLSVN